MFLMPRRLKELRSITSGDIRRLEEKIESGELNQLKVEAGFILLEELSQAGQVPAEVIKELAKGMVSPLESELKLPENVAFHRDKKNKLSLIIASEILRFSPIEDIILTTLLNKSTHVVLYDQLIRVVFPSNNEAYYADQAIRNSDLTNIHTRMVGIRRKIRTALQKAGLAEDTLFIKTVEKKGLMLTTAPNEEMAEFNLPSIVLAEVKGQPIYLLTQVREIKLSEHSQLLTKQEVQFLLKLIKKGKATNYELMASLGKKVVKKRDEYFTHIIARGIRIKLAKLVTMVYPDLDKEESRMSTFSLLHSQDGVYRLNQGVSLT